MERLFCRDDDRLGDVQLRVGMFPGKLEEGGEERGGEGRGGEERADETARNEIRREIKEGAFANFSNAPTTQ